MADRRGSKHNPHSRKAMTRRRQRAVGLTGAISMFLTLGLGPLANPPTVKADAFDAILDPIFNSITSSLGDVAAGSAAVPELGSLSLGAIGDHGRGAGLRPARNGHPAVARPGRVGRFEAGVDQQVLAHRLRGIAGLTEDQPATLTIGAVTDQPTRTVGGIDQVEPTIDRGVNLLTKAAANPILF